MNRRLLPYVNYLSENNPSPFCEYILCREFLDCDETQIKDYYDWAVRFKLYEELSGEQLSDGSWYGFCDVVTELTKNRKFKTTARAMLRMRDLSLPASDPTADKTLKLCRRYLKDEILPLELERKRCPSDVQIEIAKRDICRHVAMLSPNDESIVCYRKKAAGHFRRSVDGNAFSYRLWQKNDTDSVTADFSLDSSLYLLWLKDTLTEEEQRILLNYEWEREHFGGVTPKSIITPDDPYFIFWIFMLEKLQGFSLFGEYMKDKITPYLYGLCERLCNPSDDMPIAINRYFGRLGQYSESWNKKSFKKKDLLLRILRILNHCDND